MLGFAACKSNVFLATDVETVCCAVWKRDSTHVRISNICDFLGSPSEKPFFLFEVLSLFLAWAFTVDARTVQCTCMHVYAHIMSLLAYINMFGIVSSYYNYFLHSRYTYNIYSAPCSFILQNSANASIQKSPNVSYEYTCTVHCHVQVFMHHT